MSCFSFASTTIERPSGVSSASDASCAASASSRSVTPGSGTNSEACRLPNVIVPVLSSSSVCTSPAASTARPDIARTLRCTKRSMPAMPIADSKPPIVVGMRQTSSEIRTNSDWGAPEYIANGSSVTTASKKMMVRRAKRMLSAISFGVFCRSAPSTSAIIRSRKLWPGSDVTRTLIQSDSTRVPPVTADRSPPDSRMTGADSPVIADSSTDATPSMISPSPGMNSPARTRTTLPARSRAAGTVSVVCPSAFRRFATVSVRALRSVSACALPRPSAIASAKLANRTVSQSQNVIWNSNPRPGRSRIASRTSASVVMRLPTSTTNITGFFIIVRGWSLRAASRVATRMISGFHRDFAWVATTSKDLAFHHEKVFHNRPQAQRREERERSDDEHDAHEERREERRRHGERPRRRRHAFLHAEVPGDGEHRQDHQEAADERGHAERVVVPGRVRAQPAERRSVVAGRRGEGVEDLRQPVRPRVRQGGQAEGRRHDRNPGQHENRQREHEDDEHGHLHVEGLNLLAEVFRRAADHQPRNEHGQDDEHEDAVHAGADTAEDHLAQHDVHERHQAPERRERVVHAVDGAAARIGRDRREEGGARDAEPDFFALHVAARR